MFSARRKYNDIIGTKFGRLLILEELPIGRSKSGRSNRYVSAKCECGVIKKFRLDRLTGFETLSCGCIQKEWARSWLKSRNKGYKNKQAFIRSSKEYYEWRNMCFKRDDYTCQVTGERGGDLVVHHLEPFNIIINDLDEYNFMDSKILFDIDNGITLSRYVHNLFHKEYGKRIFTKQNFLDFKQKYNAEQQ